MGEAKRILIIDDDPEVTRYLSRVILCAGYEVEVADNGQQGLERAQSGIWAMLISDLYMPGKPNGLDLIRALRDRRPEVPLVVISGFPTEDRLNACRELGVREFLTKPFEISFIRGVLKRVLEDPGGQSKGQGEGG